MFFVRTAVKIERRRGIKKVRITHNKTLFWSIIALLILLGIVIFFIVTKKPDNTKPLNNMTEIKECNRDSDCVKVQTGCCPCSMGGEEVCVPVSEQGKYNELLRECDPRIFCIAMYACNIESCGCVNNKCSFLFAERKET